MLVRTFPDAAEQQQTPDPRLQERRERLWRRMPPLRADPFAPDQDFDGQRVRFLHDLWHSQDALLRGRDRQVEENIRMLCGQHWSVYSELTGRFESITQYLTEEERRWRQFPVLNRTLLWFMLLHARMTENPPIITFQPSSGDRFDAQLAEVMDTVFKVVWKEASMLENIDLLTSWLIPGGTAYLKSRIDLRAGEIRRYEGPAALTLLDPDGTPVLGANGAPIVRHVERAPYGPDGEVRARLLPDGTVEFTGEPHTEREGAIAVDVLSPLECRGEWGANIPWHKKAWHIHRVFLTPEQVYDAYGVEMEPEITGASAEEVGELQRLLFGAGFFGTAGNLFDRSGEVQSVKQGFIAVYEGWMRPCAFEGMEETEDSPGGRLIATTATRCLRDGPRYAPFPNTSPIRRFDFVRVPGRPHGTSPQEMLNGPARTRNRIVQQILQHTNLAANPTKLIDRACGIEEGQLTGRPGEEVTGNFPPGREPVRYVSPPNLSADVYRALDILTREFDDLGNIEGALGSPPTTDSSGELVKELRFNSDRFVGPTQRRSVIEIARMVEDWMVMLPIIWDMPKILRVAGEDTVAQTISVVPEMFRLGKVNVEPDVESMLPESRGERQAKVLQLWQAGAFGPPDSPQAIEVLLETARFAHLGRAMRPGGSHRVMAEQENGTLARGGVNGEDVVVLEWYDHAVHLMVHERYMAGPEYLKLPVAVQQQFALHRADHIGAMQAAARMNIARRAEVRAAETQAAVATQAAGQVEAEALGVVQGPPDRGPTQETPRKTEVA